MPSFTEAQHQSFVLKWSRQPGVRECWPELALLHHIPNGGKRDVIEAKNLKRAGVKAGVPDLCLPVARGKYHGLYIELKTTEGKMRADQNWWISALNEQGYLAEVCRGWESAVRVLQWYLSPPAGGS